MLIISILKLVYIYVGYRETINMGGDSGEIDLAQRVVTTVAQAKGVDPTELRPLTEVVDPDSLDELADAARNDTVQIYFEYEGHRVTIDNAGEISLQSVDT
jgi:hypothetical protein